MEGARSPLERRSVILFVLYSFYEKGREEVSLPEFLECIKNFQQKMPLNYNFSEQFLYSSDLMEDLRDLEYQGFAHRYTYRHDSFIPKSYITLTGMGKSRAAKIGESFPEAYLSALENSVKAAIQSAEEMWRIYARQTNPSYHSERIENC